jgi:uncharacterized damage-inducible protein DinB
MDKRELPDVDGFTGELELLARILQDGTREWRKELGVVGRDALRWQAREDGPSIGAIMYHLADCEDYWFRVVAAGQPDSAEIRARYLSQETDQYGGNWPKPPRKSLQEYYDMLDEVRAQTLSLLRELGSADHVGRRPGGKREYTLRWIITHMAQHEPYHAGQCVILKDQFRRRGSAPKPEPAR